MVCFVLRQTYAIFKKNFINNCSNVKKLICEFIFPMFITLLYALLETIKNNDEYIIAIKVLQILLKLYIGFIGLSAIRQLITLFITQKTENYRQYQMIFGLSMRTHTLSNLIYMKIYLSITIIPFYLVINFYHFNLVYVFNFAAFVISSCYMTLMLTAFFSDHKIATEIIGLVFSLASFLSLFYSHEKQQDSYTYVQYLAMMIPNSSFAIAIMDGNITASLWSLSLVKVYLIVYTCVQFPQYYLKKIMKFKLYLCNKVFSTKKQSIQQFELNQIIDSQLNNDTLIKSESMIDIIELSKVYYLKNVPINALNKITTKIEQQKIFGLLGRNGAGKTTLVDIITGISQPTSGRILMSKNQDNQNKKIGICYQHQILYENLTVEQTLNFYYQIKAILQLQIRKTKLEHIQEIISLLGIHQQRKKKVKQLSGGNKRKLSIGICIIGRPQILIFDEPTSGLDPISRRMVWSIFKKLRSQYKNTIILTTHHLDEAEQLSDVICVIEKGNILVQNTPTQIKQKYGKCYYLNIHHNQPLEQYMYQSIIEKYNFKVQLCQNSSNTLKYCLKHNKIIPNFVQKQLLINMLQQLQQYKSQDHAIILQANNLQQSFMAIIKDSENSDDSLDFNNRQNIRSQPILNDNRYYSTIFRFIKQTIGMFVRSFYYYKMQSVRTIIMFCLNILMYVVYRFFNHFLQQNLQSAKPKEQNTNNLLIVQGYIMMSSIFITLPVYEKQKNIRPMLNTRNLSPISYWFGTFIFDYCLFFLNFIIITQVASIQFKNLPYIPFLYMGIATILCCYSVSFIFNKTKTANSWFFIIQILLSFIVLPSLLLQKLSQWWSYLLLIRYIYPFYDIEILALKSNPAFNLILNDSNKSQTIFYVISFYFIVLCILEINLYAKIKMYICRSQPISEICQQQIRFISVSKLYKSFQALKNVSFDIDKQHVALLGHNGAGKSTTFNLLSAQMNPSSGTVFLETKKKVLCQKTLQSAGICYQQNTMWQQMSSNEILTIISYIIPVLCHNDEINSLYESLQYESVNINKRFSTLSGGNKRKLCMIVALYGKPNLLLLDECSTGLDPSSRSAMVDSIKQSSYRTVLFTTHSIGEAEDICSKAIILNKGKIIQFNYIFKLKQKYYNCFWIDLITQSEQQQNFQQLVQKVIKMTWKIIKKDNQIIRLEFNRNEQSLCKIMKQLQSMQKQGSIIAYNVLDSKFEDTYMRIIANQQ